MGEFSLTHLLILAVIFLVIFGPSRLPGLGKSIGQAIKGFKQGLNDTEREINVDDSKLPPEQVAAREADKASDPVKKSQKDSV